MKRLLLAALTVFIIGYSQLPLAAPPNPQPQGRPVVQTPQPVRAAPPPTVQRPVSQPTVQRPAVTTPKTQNVAPKPVSRPTVQSPTQKPPSSTVTKPTTPQIQKTQPSATSAPKPTFATTPVKSAPSVKTTQPITKPTVSQPVKTQVVPTNKVVQPTIRSITLPGAPGSTTTAVIPKTEKITGAKGVARSVTTEKQATPVAIRQNVAVATPVVAKKVTDNVTAKTNQLKSAPPAVKTDSQKVSDLVLQYTNVERVKNGLPPLKQSPTLTELASFQSNSQAAAGIMAHDSNKVPTGWGTFNERAAKVDFGGNYSTAENVTQAPARAIPNDKAGQEAYAKQIINSWMNSPKHKENILSPKSQYLGVGLQDGYATQVFASSEGKLKAPLPSTNSGVRMVTDNVKDKATQSQSTTSATKRDRQDRNSGMSKTGGATQPSVAKAAKKDSSFDSLSPAEKAKSLGLIMPELHGTGTKGDPYTGHSFIDQMIKEGRVSPKQGAGASKPTSKPPPDLLGIVKKAEPTAAQAAKPSEVTNQLLSANPKTKAELQKAIQLAEQALPSMAASLDAISKQAQQTGESYKKNMAAVMQAKDTATSKPYGIAAKADSDYISVLGNLAVSESNRVQQLADKLSQWRDQLGKTGSGTTTTQTATSTLPGQTPPSTALVTKSNTPGGSSDKTGTQVKNPSGSSDGTSSAPTSGGSSSAGPFTPREDWNHLSWVHKTKQKYDQQNKEDPSNRGIVPSPLFKETTDKFGGVIKKKQPRGTDFGDTPGNQSAVGQVDDRDKEFIKGGQDYMKEQDRRSRARQREAEKWIKDLGGEPNPPGWRSERGYE